MTKKEKLNLIRPLLNFAALSPTDLVFRTKAVKDGITNNPNLQNPPIEPAALEAALNAYVASGTEALDSKKAKARQDKLRMAVVRMLRQLAHWVEAASKGDMAIFLSSGFVPRSTTASPPQPLPQPNILRVDQGNTGQLLAIIKAVRRARNYDVRYAPLGTGGTPGAWTTITVPSAKSAVAINNLTPGTTYTFQVRAYGKLGHTDWSGSVDRMCI
jgi:hypothetical protein